MTTRHAPPLSTFEVHFTDPDEFLVELEKDLATEAIEDRIVRLARVDGGATLGMLSKGGYRVGDDRAIPTSWARARFIEASYISGRLQLVKLSAYAGWVWGDVEQHAEGTVDNDRCEASERRIIAKLQGALQRIGADVRGGGLYVEDGVWTAGTKFTIEAPAEMVCAHCGEPIYFANLHWRHRGTRQAESYGFQTCPRCKGTKEIARAGFGNVVCPDCQLTPGFKRTLNHVAEPAG